MAFNRGPKDKWRHGQLGERGRSRTVWLFATLSIRGTQVTGTDCPLGGAPRGAHTAGRGWEGLGLLPFPIPSPWKLSCRAWHTLSGPSPACPWASRSSPRCPPESPQPTCSSTQASPGMPRPQRHPHPLCTGLTQHRLCYRGDVGTETCFTCFLSTTWWRSVCVCHAAPRGARGGVGAHQHCCDGRSRRGALCATVAAQSTPI